jgi:hypothetical protein
MRSRAWVVLAIAFVLLVVPLAASAQILGGVQCSGTDCQACHVVSLLQSVINFGLGLTIPIVVVLIAYAGFLFFTSAESPGRVSTAKSIFKHAVIGFVIAICSFVIVNTILHTLLNDDYVNGWNRVDCYDPNARQTTGDIGTWLNGAIDQVTNGPTPPVDTSGTPSNGLFKSNVTLKSGVQTAGLQQSTIDAVNNVAAQCGGCSIIITSGTDGSHVSTSLHYQGEAVDIGYSDTLSTYLKNLTPTTNYVDPGQPAYKDPTTGYVWSVEGADQPGSTGLHYHVSSTGH